MCFHDPWSAQYLSTQFHQTNNHGSQWRPEDDSHPKNMFMLLCTPHVQPFKHVIPKQEGIDPNLKIYIYCQADGVSVRIYIYIDIDIDVYK